MASRDLEQPQDFYDEQTEAARGRSFEYLAEGKLPLEVKKLLTEFDRVERRLILRIHKLRVRFDNEPAARDTLTLDIHRNEFTLHELQDRKKRIYQFGRQGKVKKAAEVMAEVYNIMRTAEEGWEGERGESLGKRGDLEAAYLAAKGELDEVLDEAQTKYCVELARSNHPDALLETYLVSLDRYQELFDKILHLPKAERDRNVDVLLTTLSLYEAIPTEDFQQSVAEAIKLKATDILKHQQERFTGLRGLIQRGVEKGTSFAIDHFSGLLGDEDSIARNLFVKAAKLGRDLSKPVQYDPELIKALADETIEQLRTIAPAIDLDKVRALHAACLELKANPDNLLSPEDREKFKKPFREFLPVSAVIIERVIAVQSDILHDAYVLSHGKDSKEFDADWTLRAKFLSHQGRDLIRLLQMYSPFGVFLPATAERKKGKPPLHLQSAYSRGWFKDHPIARVALQTGEMTALLFLGYGMLRGVAWGTHVYRRIPLAPGRRLVGGTGKILKTLLTKRFGKIPPFLPLVGQIYLAYEITDEIKNINLSSREEEIFDILKKYHSLREVSQEDQEKVRQLTLINEIYKRRGYFQGIGYDLATMDIDFWNRFVAGNIIAPSGSPFRDSMVKTGEFREAVLAANRKLALMGFRTYEIR